MLSSWAKKMVLWPVRFYRRYLSPLKRTPTCRFLPTCSEYTIEAIECRGVWKGGLLAAWRICRCNPLGRAGYDPVPRGAVRPQVSARESL